MAPPVSTEGVAASPYGRTCRPVTTTHEPYNAEAALVDDTTETIVISDYF